MRVGGIGQRYMHVVVLDLGAGPGESVEQVLHRRRLAADALGDTSHRLADHIVVALQLAVGEEALRVQIGVGVQVLADGAAAGARPKFVLQA